MKWEQNKENCKKCFIHIGPMSKIIVDSIIEFANDNHLFLSLIASRRQIDYNGGYVNGWTTKTLSEYVRNKTDKVLVCRDHGGLSQGSIEDDGIDSFLEDAKYLDVIHIDPWKKIKDMYENIDYTVKIIKKCFEINQDCLYEVGTEEAIRFMTDEYVNAYLILLKSKLSREEWQRIVYCVIQSGTKLLEDGNVGNYDVKRLNKMVEVCKRHNVLSKEHNGDYLEVKVIAEKHKEGLDAINIAPEYAQIQTKIILEKVIDNEDKINLWYDLCIKNGSWKKWFSEDFNPKNNKEKVIQVAGHYVFSDKEFLNIIDFSFVEKEVKEAVKERINKTLLEINR